MPVDGDPHRVVAVVDLHGDLGGSSPADDAAMQDGGDVAVSLGLRGMGGGQELLPVILDGEDEVSELGGHVRLLREDEVVQDQPMDSPACHSPGLGGRAIVRPRGGSESQLQACQRRKGRKGYERTVWKGG
eukprot:630888-Hanusia_phi.AAC.3